MLLAGCGTGNEDDELTTQVRIQSVVPTNNSSNDYKLILVGVHDTSVVIIIRATNREAKVFEKDSEDINRGSSSLVQLEQQIKQSGNEVKSVLKNRFKDGIYYGQILTAQGISILTYDATAIDAISIAFKTRSSIYFEKGLIKFIQNSH